MTVTNNAVIGMALKYIEANPQERDLLRSLIVLALHGPPIVTATTTPAHVTCSVALVSADGRVLHTRAGGRSWKLPGGHVDGADQSLLGAALRHLAAQAEVEANGLIPASVLPVDVTPHPVDAVPTRDEPEHVHYEATFLLRAADGALEQPASRQSSRRWVSIADVRGKLGDKLRSEAARSRV
ncbi:NUDIX hydrolase [Frankia sp. R43]|uniref:NUDIX domain-containing protein n=1 Tax=unclassified Frankia TaxID=2632575 RepID=UPI0006D97CFF|nr:MULTISPECIES: NUDIX domain-containing protein [unclassified Frankia]KPM57459.1 NUDIX hydrolase [Frankia sp. R43]